MDLKSVRKVICLLQKHPLIAELEITNMMGLSKIRIRRSPSSSSENQASGIEDSRAGTMNEKAVSITSPLVGRFLATADSEERPLLLEGDTVAEGDTVCYIEALRILRPVISEVTGIVQQVLPEIGQSIEYGQPLFLITKSDSS
ncbi:hypothetical protein KJ733_01695 [Patescibacteria group bacterium]|nr:hypothetical protein [Patescibacteria group bacterium]